MKKGSRSKAVSKSAVQCQADFRKNLVSQEVKVLYTRKSGKKSRTNLIIKLSNTQNIEL